MPILRCTVNQTSRFDVEVQLTDEEAKDGEKTTKAQLLSLINQEIASWDFSNCEDEIEEGTWEITDE